MPFAAKLNSIPGVATSARGRLSLHSEVAWVTQPPACPYWLLAERRTT